MLCNDATETRTRTKTEIGSLNNTHCRRSSARVVGSVVQHGVTKLIGEVHVTIFSFLIPIIMFAHLY